MKIWIIAENWAPRIGGIERYLEGIAENLKKNGHEVTVVTNLIQPLLRKERRLRAHPSPYEGEGKGMRLSDESDSLNIVRHRFFYPIIPKWFPLFILLKIKTSRNKPDVIIAGKALFEGRLALLLKKTVGIPYIVCTYGMEIATWQSHPRTKKQLQHVLKNAHHVLAINKKTQKELLELGADPKKQTIMYPGVDLEKLEIKNNPDEVLKKYDITAPYIISVARLVKRKGVDDLIRAVASLNFSPSYEGESKGVVTAPATPTPAEAGRSPLSKGEKIQLVIIGDGPERKNLENLTHELNAPVKFLGAIADAEIHALYSRAQLFALTPKELPGDYEGFGIVYIEAGYYGLPVVATNTGGVPEAVVDGITSILAKPADIPSIANAIQILLDNPDKASQYGEMGKKRVKEQFTWPTIIKTLEEILTSV